MGRVKAVLNNLRVSGGAISTKTVIATGNGNRYIGITDRCHPKVKLSVSFQNMHSSIHWFKKSYRYGL